MLISLFAFKNKNMASEKSVRNGKRSAIISFFIGTIIFVIYFISSKAEILLIGYAFIAIAGLINLVILIDILIKSNKDKENRNNIYITCGLMLLNIPIMLFYCWVTMILTGIMRIIFTNASSAELKNIKITGCESKFVEKLMPGQSKTVWVNITGDCSINVDYLLNGQLNKENVAGYVTGGMGQKMQYNIGGKNKKSFKENNELNTNIFY